MGKGIVRCKRREGEGGSDRLLETAGVAQCANQSMMGIKAGGICRNCGAKALDGAGRIAGGELIEALLCVPFCGNFVRFCHHIL